MPREMEMVTNDISETLDLCCDTCLHERELSRLFETLNRKQRTANINNISVPPAGPISKLCPLYLVEQGYLTVMCRIIEIKMVFLHLKGASLRV